MRRHRVFVSSVQSEFAAERRALRDFIQADALLGRFFTVFLFEDLHASDVRPDEAYLGELGACDVYLALFGDAYGREGADGRSPTEIEFDRATELGIPRLVFVKGGSGVSRHPRMRALVARAERQLVRRGFASLPELTAQAYASLVDHLAATGAVATRPFDAAACPEATLGDLSEEKISEFLEEAQRGRGYALAPGTPVRGALAHMNLLDGDSPSHAAVLLFGREPQRFMLSSEVKCMHFHGVEVRKPIPSYQVYRGTVFDVVDQSVDFVLSKVARAVGTRAAGPRAPVDYELPPEAVAEAIVNAVAHRDYASSASVQVMLFSDRLEVWNPGRLPPPLTPEALRRPHASIPRNPLLAEPLFLAGYIEKAGTGTLDMIARCAEAGLPAPAFRQDGEQFVQTLGRPVPATGPAPEATPEAAPEVSEEVARLLPLCETPAGRKELQAALGLRDDDHFRMAYLNPAMASGLLAMTIPDKPSSPRQKYRLTGAGRAWLAARKPGGTA